jgi:NhaP-type Na+/H+ and K+/H+ antiporter
MFVVRPIAVFVSLMFTAMSTREKLFLCVVRETGVIPIVLAVGAVSQFPELLQLLPLVAWVVMWTLVILPAITPWWARTLQLTKTNEEICNSTILNTILQTSQASEKIG